MIAGNGTSNTKMATNEATAITHSSASCSVRDPMRQAAFATIAITAGLMP